MDSILNMFSNKKSLSILKDPFNKSCIESVSLRMYKGSFAPYKVRISGEVCFQNGATCGEQKFTADSLEILLIKVKDFIDSLDGDEI